MDPRMSRLITITLLIAIFTYIPNVHSVVVSDKKLTQTKLFQALKKNEITEANLKEVAKEIASYNGDLSPFLAIAATAKQQKAVGLLLAAGANPDTTNKLGLPLIYNAIVTGQVDIFQRLLDYSANIDTIDDRQISDKKNYLEFIKDRKVSWQASIAQVEQKTFKTSREVKWLKEMKSSTDSLSQMQQAIEVRNTKQEQLYVAVRKNDIAAIEQIAKRGDSLKYKNWQGFTPLLLAAAYQNDEALLKILELSDEYSIDELSTVMQGYIRAYSKMNRINSFRAAYSQVVEDARWKFYLDQLGYFMLHTNTRGLYNAYASLYGERFTLDYNWKSPEEHRRELATYMDAYVYARADSRKRNLENTDYHVIESLLKKGANPNAKIWGERTALHYFAGSKDIDMLKLFLQYGADINVRNKAGKTPLFYAYPYLTSRTVDQVSKNTIDFLLESGADPSLKDSNGNTAFANFGTLFSGFFTSLEELERKHQLALKQEEVRRQQEAMLAEQRRLKEEKSKFNWGKVLASTVGFVAGNGLNLPAEEQANILMGIVQDGFSGDDSISNTMNAANQVAINARSEQTSLSYQDTTNSSAQVINSARLTGTSKQKVAAKWLAVSEAYKDLKRQCSNQQLSYLSFNANFTQASGFVAKVSGQCGTFNAEQVFIYWGYDYQKGDPHVGHREDEWLRKVQIETAVNACSQKAKSVNNLKVLSKGNSDNATREEFVDIFSGDLGYQWIAWQLTCS